MAGAPKDRAPLELKLFGYPEFYYQGQAISPKSKKAVALLCYLGMIERPASKRELLLLLWSEKQAQSLKVALQEIKALPGSGHWLVSNKAVFVTVKTDLSEFRQALNRKDYPKALDLFNDPDKQALLTALNLKKATAFIDWLDTQRDELNQLLRETLRVHSLALENQSLDSQALDLWQKLVRLDPLSETAHRGIMRLKLKQGHIQEALAQYELCTRVLKEELGSLPSPDTQRLASVITGSSQSKVNFKSPLPPRLPDSVLRPPIMIGREREWALMEEAWRKGQAIFLAGSAGVGKTRLLMDFALSKGPKLGIAYALPGDYRVPYSSHARTLERLFKNYPDFPLKQEVKQVLVQIVPHVFPDIAKPLHNQVNDTEQFEAHYYFTKAAIHYFDMLVSDDVHFFDPQSMAAGNYGAPKALQTEAGHDIAGIMCTYRPKKMPASYLEDQQRLANQGVITIIKINPFSLVEVRRFINSLKLKASDSLVKDIHKLSGGKPQHILEILKSLLVSNEPFEKLNQLELTDTIESILLRRLNHLSKVALDIARVIALFGQNLSGQLLLAILELDQDTLANAFDELQQAQMMDSEGYFVHDLIAQVVLKNIKTLKLEFLHRQIAQALEKYGGEPARISHHWKEAGERHRAMTWTYEAALVSISQGAKNIAKTWLRDILNSSEDEALKAKAKTLLNRNLNLESGSKELRNDHDTYERSRLTIRRKRLPSSLLRPPVRIGREREWALMEEAWAKGQSIFIAGPAGSGKTRLMMDFAKSKGDRHGPGGGRWGDSYVPFSSCARNVELNIEALSVSPTPPWVSQQLARIAPHLFPDELQALNDEDVTGIFKAFHYLALACCDFFDVLIAEDLHYCDAASNRASVYAFSQIHHLGIPDEGFARPITTYRPAEMPPHQLEVIRRFVNQGMGVIIELEPLSENQTATFLESLELASATKLAPDIHKLSGGNPQLILEAIKGLHETGSLDTPPERLSLSDKLEGIIQKRLKLLSSAALELAQTLALLQQKTKPELVLEIMELDPFRLNKLYQELEQAQILSDGTFVHDLIYEVVSKHTSDLLKILLHKRIARVLEKQEAEPARVAEHWLAAGETQAALPWRLEAAKVAIRQGLNETAQAWLEQVVSLTNDEGLKARAVKLAGDLKP